MPRRALFWCLAAIAVLAATDVVAERASSTIDSQSFDQVERGRYLAIVGDCAACHSDPGSGHAFAGGRPIETPFGQLLAPNITPDRETGIGDWTDDEFVGALLNGTGRHGELLYPAMPYTYMTRTSRADALAIRAYLATVPAVGNDVVSNQLPFPFRIRSVLRVWNALNFKAGPFKPEPTKSAEWNRGAYIVEGLAHCGMCHTPKTTLGGDDAGRKFQGYALQGQFAPDITGDRRTGIGSWSIEETVAYLATGHNRASGATGLMAEMITRSTARMRADDLHAIATYLKDQPGPQAARDNSATAVKPAADVTRVGAAIYAAECSGCHAPDGVGVPGLIPMLKGAPIVQQADPAGLLRVVLHGARSAATDAAPTAPAMPSFAWVLSDRDVADVLTYVRNAWGNAAPPVDEHAVAKVRAGAEHD